MISGRPSRSRELQDEPEEALAHLRHLLPLLLGHSTSRSLAGDQGYSMSPDDDDDEETKMVMMMILMMILILNMLTK